MSKFKITQVLLALYFIAPLIVKAQADSVNLKFFKMDSLPIHETGTIALGKAYGAIYFYPGTAIRKDNATGLVTLQINGDTGVALSHMYNALKQQSERMGKMANILNRLNLDFIVSMVQDAEQRKELEQFVKEYRSK